MTVGGDARVVHEIKGSLDGKGLRVAVIAGRFNELVTRRLVDGAVAELQALGVAAQDVTVAWAPGAFEVPMLAAAAAKAGRFDAVVGLGAVIRGDTDHYRFVAEGAAQGILRVALDTGVPVLFGVLTVDETAQAMERAGGKQGNKGAETARAAVQTANALRALRER